MIDDIFKARCFLICGVLVVAVVGCKTPGHESKTGPNQQNLVEVWREPGNQLLCGPVVRLAGVIKNETFPGPPNYKSISKGDEVEHYWILKLADPIDVAEDPEYPVPDENAPQLNIRDVQLNLDVHLNADYTAYRQFLDKRVVVTGQLTQGFTVDHKTAILINVQDIRSGE